MKLLVVVVLTIFSDGSFTAVIYESTQVHFSIKIYRRRYVYVFDLRARNSFDHFEIISNIIRRIIYQFFFEIPFHVRL